MKKRFIIILNLLIVLLDIYPQNVTFKEAFTKLDTTRMSTKILYDLVIPKDSFVKFTGINDTACAVADRWKYMYAWLQFAHLKACTMPDLQTVSDIISADIAQDKIPIGVINLKYNLIKTNAFDDNLLSFHDDYFWDGSNLSETPYTQSRSFIASALTNSVKSLSPSFFLDESLFFTETGEQIQTLSIDFDDGNGYVTLYPDDEYEVEYSSYGEKIIQIEVHSNNNVYFCKTIINVEAPPPSYVPSNSIKPVSATYQGQTYYGKYEILFGCNNNEKLKKPVIFVEGFDPLNSNKLEDGSLKNIANQNGFLEKLHDRGYDVILLDFADGGAKIQANAMVLRELINTINQQKTTANELVVVGASMGGLVARYALANMEQQNEDHKTRLYVSFDAPQQGAYYSLSAQHLLNQLDNMERILKIILWLSGTSIAEKAYYMNCDAAKQMVVYHHSATNVNTHKANPHQLRTDFISDLNSLTTTGYPQHCRKIAVSEGSGNGENGLNTVENPYVDVNTWTDSYKVILKMSPIPDGEASSILNMDIRLRFLFLWTLSIDPALENVYITVDNTKPYDSAPGGYYPVIGSVLDGLSNGLGLGLAKYPNNECFIPTMSALDIKSSESLSYNIRDSITHGNDAIEITNHNITAFDAIYAEETNHQHISNGISSKMTDWLIGQIDHENLYLQNMVYSSKSVQYEAPKSIFAGSNVTGGTQGNLDIKDNSNITFTAGKSIVLKPGFSVKIGSTFRSYIKDFSCPAISQMNMVSASKHNLNADNTNINTHDKVEVAPPLVDMKNSNGVRISPNPTDGDFSVYIEGADQQKIKIQLYNLIGSLVYNDFVCLDQSKTISLNKQPAGIYLIKIIDHKGKIKTGKIIKL